MKLQPITDQDIDGVLDLWERCGLTRPWNDPLKDIEFARGRANSDVLVYSTNGEVKAAIMLGHDGHRGTLYYLAVDPSSQRMGLGRQLVAGAEAWLRDRGVWKVNILVRNDNSDVRNFYETLGYSLNEVFSMGRRLG